MVVVINIYVSLENKVIGQSSSNIQLKRWRFLSAVSQYLNIRFANYKLSDDSFNEKPNRRAENVALSIILSWKEFNCWQQSVRSWRHWHRQSAVNDSAVWERTADGNGGNMSHLALPLLDHPLLMLHLSVSFNRLSQLSPLSLLNVFSIWWF